MVKRPPKTVNSGCGPEPSGSHEVLAYTSVEFTPGYAPPCFHSRAHCARAGVALTNTAAIIAPTRSWFIRRGKWPGEAIRHDSRFVSGQDRDVSAAETAIMRPSACHPLIMCVLMVGHHNRRSTSDALAILENPL